MNPEELLKRIEQLEERVRRIELDILPIRRIGPVLNEPIYKPFDIDEIEEELKNIFKTKGEV